MRNLTASDRSALIKLASSLPAGSSERKAILAGLLDGWVETVGDYPFKYPRKFNVPGKHILDNAEVLNRATVSENAKIYDRAHVTYKARVFGNAEVYGDAWVGGDAKVGGKARIGGTAVILGGEWDGSEGEVLSGTWLAPGVPKIMAKFNVPKIHIFGRAKVYGRAKVFENAKVYGNARVYGTARVFGKARIGGTAIIVGGNWDGSEGPITSGAWKAPGIPAGFY